MTNRMLEHMKNIGFSDFSEECEIEPPTGVLLPSTSLSPEGAVELLNAKLRIAALEDRMDSLEQNAAESPLAIPIVDLPTETGIWLTRPFTAIVRHVGEEEYVATFFDANINASGDTAAEAFNNLKQMVASSYRLLCRHRECLGAEPSRQLAVLKTYIGD